MSQGTLDLGGRRPYRLPAPRYPFTPPAPEAMDGAAGYVDPEGRSWCGDCASMSLYWRARGRRLPKGWARIPRRPRAGTGHVCQPQPDGCGEVIA